MQVFLLDGCGADRQLYRENIELPLVVTERMVREWKEYAEAFLLRLSQKWQ